MCLNLAKPSEVFIIQHVVISLVTLLLRRLRPPESRPPVSVQIHSASPADKGRVIDV